ncbi:hypothetical protein L7F22_039449 [Adiantum nelumboides]|nr:hypothetical protein [Adiantum nelumboides]
MTYSNTTPTKKAASSASSCSYPQRSSSFRSFGTSSLCSFSLRKGSGGDGSDDEDDDGERPRSLRNGRIGGCYRTPEQGQTRDDSNKENVAPLRRLSQRDLHTEVAAHQADITVRRTRTQAAVPMSDRSDSMPGSPRSFSRRSFRRTVSTPITTRKRSRSIFDNCDHLENGESVDTIIEQRLPSSRPRLEAFNSSQGSTDEDLASVFHSSQTTPMSEVFSIIGSEAAMSDPISRCTTPEASEAGDVKEQDSLETDDETSKYTNIFAHARALLRYGADPNVHIVGRERERGAIQRFMQQRFGLFAHMERSAMPEGDSMCTDMNGAMDGGSLYVCGLPGTGKTALIRSVLADIQQSQEFLRENERLQVAFIDCMTIQHPRELFRRILNVLHGDKFVLPSGEAGDAEAERQVTSLVKDQKRQTLIVLDEIDHLLRSRVHQNILYRLFSWPQKDSKACALIGIANSLDLTERFVPLLASKGAAPAVLNFRPFEAEEIKTVIGSRLGLLQSNYNIDAKEQDADQHDQNDDEIVPLFVPAAFELVARKIAAATGDLRKALDACRLAVELVEQETIRKSTSTAAPIDICSLTPSTAPKITPAHILKVVSTVLGSPQLNKIRGLGLQPKLILLALLVAQKRRGYGLNVLGGGSGGGVNKSMMGVCSSNNDGTLMCEIESTYSAMLKNDDFPILESSELIDVMEGLEVEGIVKITNVNGSSITSSSNSTRVGGVSPSAKRAAKRQLLASYRRMELIMSSEEIIRGIMTSPPASMQSQSLASVPNTIVIEAIKRIWQREERNAERAKGWEKVAEEAQKVRDNELGGGRGALGI